MVSYIFFPVVMRARMKLVQEPKVNVIKSFFDPLNMLLIFTNALFFAIVQSLFFWFVISKQVENTIEKITEDVGSLAQTPELSLATELYIKDLDADRGMIERAKEQQKAREEKNEKLLQKYIYPIIGVLFGLVILCFAALILTGERFTVVDTVLLLMVIGAFATEFVFYFVVIEPMEYISLAELMNQAVKPTFTEGVPLPRRSPRDYTNRA